jgi:uncharacterized protein YybS (DUF2232 family)
MNKPREIVESALLVALAVALFLASYVLPVVGVVFAFLCPAPLVVLGLRHSLTRAFLGLGVASILVTLFAGISGALFFVLSFGILGVGLGYLSRRYKNSIEIILYGVLISLGGKLVLMVILAKLTGVNPFDVRPDEMMAVIDKVASIYKEMGMSKETLNTARSQMEATISMIPKIFPALLIMASAVDCFLSYVISRTVLYRLGSNELPPIRPFARWSFPKSVFWVFILSGVLSFMGLSGTFPEIFLRIGLNLRLLSSGLLMLQGLSVFWFYLSYKNVKKVIRWILVGMVMLFPLLTQIALILGIIDMWLDLRSRIGR